MADYVNYICPVNGAQEAMRKIDPALAESSLIFPTKADLDKVHQFRSLTAAEEKEFTSSFQNVLGS